MLRDQLLLDISEELLLANFGQSTPRANNGARDE